jgi:signal peptidase II
MVPKYKLFILAFVLALGLDQATKIWARHSLKPRAPQTITVINGYFDFEYAENTGSAFSLLRGRPEARYLLFGFGVIALGVVGYYLKKAQPTERRVGFELGLLAGGAVGNLIDRAAFGYVTDFILWKVGTHRWPNFNIADAALLIGIVGLLIDYKPAEKPGTAKDKSKASKAKARS